MSDTPYQIVFECFCGYEHVKKREKSVASSRHYRIDQCEMCFRRHQINIGSKALYSGLRMMYYPEGKRVFTGKEYDVDEVVRRVATAHYYNVKVLGNALANRMLEKAIGDYWNEVKGHWKFGSRPEWFVLPQ